MSHTSQRGVALITVLLIVAISITIAAYIAQQQAFWQSELEKSRDRAQARRTVQAGVDWARAILADDAAANQYDHTKEMWAMHLPAIPLEGSEIQGVIVDQQGLFNLNNLVQYGKVSVANLARLQRLLAFLGLPQDLAAALADWEDADSEPLPAGGAEDGYYLNLPSPYRAANRPLADLSELMWVRGFDAQVIKRLEPFVSVLPEHTPINVNFAAPEVLAAWIPGLSLQGARQIALERKDRPFKAIADFLQVLPPTVQGAGEGIGVSSQFFMVGGRAVQAQSEFSVKVLLNRQGIWASAVRQGLQ